MCEHGGGDVRINRGITGGKGVGEGQRRKNQRRE